MAAIEKSSEVRSVVGWSVNRHGLLKMYGDGEPYAWMYNVRVSTQRPRLIWPPWKSGRCFDRSVIQCRATTVDAGRMFAPVKIGLIRVRILLPEKMSVDPVIASRDDERLVYRDAYYAYLGARNIQSHIPLASRSRTCVCPVAPTRVSVQRVSVQSATTKLPAARILHPEAKTEDRSGRNDTSYISR